MPDAHSGYGLPVGGVLATKNVVIPFAIGQDIGCSMALTVFKESASILQNDSERFEKGLFENTRFNNQGFTKPLDNHIFNNQVFNDIKVLNRWRRIAKKQLGSSGAGNHFVEFGIVNITSKNNVFNLDEGKYLGLLSHFGSRGFGASIAEYYTNLAIKERDLDKRIRYYAWLDLATDLGKEYWKAMEFAGEYALEGHRQVHMRLASKLKLNPAQFVTNMHNFAWKEKDTDGSKIIVHRKGATPAHKGEVGIIPGSMCSPTYIVVGKGSNKYLNSSSHGAGRLMSRKDANDSISKSMLKKESQKYGVRLIGGSVEESPFAYKDIDKVIDLQKSIIDVAAKFTPKIVRMA